VAKLSTYPICEGFCLRDRIIKGGGALGARQVISLPLNALGTGIAANLLNPDDFGVFAILLVLINLSFFIVDLGTSYALVQSPVEPSSKLLRTVQRYKLIGFVICLLGYSLIAPFLVTYYHLSQWTAYLFVSCCIIGWLQSQRNYLSFRLQRQLLWSKIAAIEMAEILGYNTVLIGTAYFFRNPSCFVLGFAARWCIGSILIMRIKMSSRQSEKNKAGSFKHLVRFGLPMQSTSVVSMVKDAVNPVVVGSVAGLYAVGMINWSVYVTSLPRLPIRPFPLFLFSVVAKRNREGKSDDQYLETCAYLGVLGIAFLSLLLVLILDDLVPLLFGQKWVPAIPIASILLLTNATFIPSLIMTAFLNAKGHSSANLMLSIIWAITSWIFAVGGIIILGVLGYAVGIVLASMLGLVIQCKITQKLTGLSINFTYVFIIMGCGILSFLLAEVAENSFSIVNPYLNLFAKFFVGILTMTLAVILFQGKQIKKDIQDAVSLIGRWTLWNILRSIWTNKPVKGHSHVK